MGAATYHIHRSFLIAVAAGFFAIPVYPVCGQYLNVTGGGTTTISGDSPLSYANLTVGNASSQTNTLVIDRDTAGPAVDVSFSTFSSFASGFHSDTWILVRGANVTSGIPTMTINGTGNTALGGYSGATNNPTTLTAQDVRFIMNGGFQAPSAPNTSDRNQTLVLGGNTEGNLIQGPIVEGALFDSGSKQYPAQTFLRKVGEGSWTLAGANSYKGSTDIQGGSLLFGKRDALYGGNTANWGKSIFYNYTANARTIGTVAVQNGGTLALSVGGAGEFTESDVSLLTGSTGLGGSVTNGLFGGFRAGSAVGFDTSNAVGGTFAVASVLANTTGTLGGAIGLTKLGSNTLELSAINTYSGPTSVASGTLSIASNGVINQTSAINILPGSTFAFNSATSLTRAPSLLGSGSGSRATLGGAGTINAALTLDNLGRHDFTRQ